MKAFLKDTFLITAAMVAFFGLVYLMSTFGIGYSTQFV